MRQVIQFSAFDQGDGDSQDLVVKEVAIVNPDTDTSQSWLFKAPFPFADLALALKYTNEYISKHSIGLRWDEDGDIEYSSLKTVLVTYTQGSSTLFTFGSTRQHFLERLLERPIINLEDLHCPKYTDLCFPTTACAHPRHQFEKYRCVLKEAKTYGHYLKYLELSRYILPPVFPTYTPTPISDSDVDS